MLQSCDWLIFHHFLQLIFRLTTLTSASKRNEKSVNQKLCNTSNVLDALYSLHSRSLWDHLKHQLKKLSFRCTFLYSVLNIHLVVQKCCMPYEFKNRDPTLILLLHLVILKKKILRAHTRWRTMSAALFTREQKELEPA